MPNEIVVILAIVSLLAGTLLLPLGMYVLANRRPLSRLHDGASKESAAVLDNTGDASNPYKPGATAEANCKPRYDLVTTVLANAAIVVALILFLAASFAMLIVLDG